MAEYAIMPIEDYRRACAAVRQMTGGTEDIKSGELEAQILSIETGVQLPVLVSPGAAANLLEGKQMIDQLGNVVDGRMKDWSGEQDRIFIGVDAQTNQLYVYAATGFHNGGERVDFSGTKLDVTPTKYSQEVSMKQLGQFISSVYVAAIPAVYQDISPVTAAAEDVLPGKVIVTANGAVQGAMPNARIGSNDISVSSSGKVTANARINQAGYASAGSIKGSLQLVTAEGTTVAPRTVKQTIVSGQTYVTGPIIVDAIPAEYQNVMKVTAEAEDVAPGKQFVNSAGTLIEGAMPEVVLVGATLRPVEDNPRIMQLYIDGDAGYFDGRAIKYPLLDITYEAADGTTKQINIVHNGVTSGTVDGLNTTSVEVPEGYTEGGAVTFDEVPIQALLDTI